MKKIFGIILFLIAFAIGADVKPFVFENVAKEDSAAQQAEFDYLLKYKMFGANGITFNGQNIKVPDKSGWFGTADGNFELKEVDHIIGGPILVGGNISFDNGQDGFTTGPVRVSGDIIVKQTGFKDRANVSAGFNCVAGTVDPKFANIVASDSQFFGDNYTSCPPSVPEIKTTLRTPTFNDDTITYKEAIFKNGGIYTLDIADYCDLADTTKKLCDIYIEKITLNNDARLYVKMPVGGKLTRIFLKEGLILDATHPQIRVMYGDNVIRNDKYSGNLLIYSTKDFIFEALAQTDSMQGTFITTGQIYIKQQMTLAGQLLSNNLFIDANFDGSGFIYVKFDPDTLDIDPELNESAALHENDSTVVIPIKLSDTATIDVYFSYCFELNDKVDSSDFNLVTDFPVCGIDTKTVKIPVGSKVPTDSIKINVKKDDIEETSDSLIIKIKIESGAVLPNGETSGELKIKIKDAPIGHVEFDTTANYQFNENDTGFVDTIKTSNKTATTRFTLDSAYTGRYTLDSITGVLTLVSKPLDYEKAITDVVKITLTDTGNVSVTRNIPISVIDVNEAPTINDVTTNLPENLIHPFMVEKLVAKDPDTKTVFTKNVFSMLEGDTSLFRVDPDGEIWAKKTFDYETDQKTYILKVLVQDKTNPALKDSAIVTVNITNSNDGPKFDRNDTTFYVDENKPFKDSVKATDQDGDKITYSIVGTVPFKIDSTGVITSTRTFDYEKEKGFTFKVVADDGKAKDTMTVNIKVTDVDEPVHAHDMTITVPENVKDTIIGKVIGEDEDGDSVKFYSNDTLHYVVDSITGTIRLVEPFDYEKTKSDTLKVIVRDIKGNTDTATVVINVDNVNEPPVLQPNDSLIVPENCKSCIIGIITAVDPDSDKVIYEVKEPGFTIDTNGVLKLTDPLDYEKTPEVKITVIAKDSSGAADTATYVIKVTDINEPVHVQDTTCSVKENYTGKVCKITATDEDKTTPKYIITDTTNYSIDSTGVITIKNPIDYEKKTKDTVTVIVTDGEFSDTAQIIIRVLDEPEDVKITEWDKNPPPDTVKTNDPDHEFKWTICEGDSCTTHYDNPRIHKDTTIKVCNDKKTVCDSIVVLFNDAPPVVTLTNVKSTDALIDYITIEEEKDDKIYVNKKDNELKVTVRDTIHKTEKTFPINVKLDTLHISSKNVTEYNYLIDESLATYTQIGGGLIEVKEVVKDGDRKITLTKIVDKKMNPIDTVQTVTYTVKQDGKELTITYKTDNLTGQRVSDYEVSYKADSCTTVSYYLGDDKKITKNKEGNIAFTVSYVYTDDFGNKASSKVDIIYDNIPPKVEILEPISSSSYNRNAIPVKWTVNGEVQDTLTLQRIEKGINFVVRRYVDKAGNVAADTVMVIMKEAKDIAIEVVNPVTHLNQDKIDSFYNEGNKYDKKNPYTITTLKGDDKPDPVGVGFKVDIVLPSVSPTGGLASLDDIVKNGMIPVDDKGEIVGASTKGIPVDQYVEEHCTEEFQKDYQKHGLNIPLYDVKYTLHLWIYTTQANYVNDFNVEYTLNDEDEVTAAGTVGMVVDWITDKDGHVKAKNGHGLGTGAYITKLYSKSIAKHRCDYKGQKKGDKTVKKEEDFTTFGYKRPVAK